MLFFSHLGFTLLIVDILHSLSNDKNTKNEMTIKILILTSIGSLFPDLIDKTISFILIGSGRAFGHTIIFFIIFTTLAYLLWNKEGIYFGIAMLMHLILDLGGYIPLFWPLDEIKVTNNFFQTIWTTYTNPVNLILEFSGFIIVILVLVKYKTIINENLSKIRTKDEN